MQTNSPVSSSCTGSPPPGGIQHAALCHPAINSTPSSGGGPAMCPPPNPSRPGSPNNGMGFSGLGGQTGDRPDSPRTGAIAAAGSSGAGGAGSPTDVRFSLNLRKTALLRSLLLRTEDAAAAAAGGMAVDVSDLAQGTGMGGGGAMSTPPTVLAGDLGAGVRPDSVPFFERVSSSDGEMSDGSGSGGGSAGGRGTGLSSHGLYQRQMSGGAAAAGWDLGAGVWGGVGRGGMSRGPSSMPSQSSLVDSRGNSSTMDTTDDSDDDEQVSRRMSMQASGCSGMYVCIWHLNKKMKDHLSDRALIKL